MDSFGRETQVQMDTQVGRKMDDRQWEMERWIDGVSIGRKWDHGVGG